jgi:hypothetical protein
MKISVGSPQSGTRPVCGLRGLVELIAGYAAAGHLDFVNLIICHQMQCESMRQEQPYSFSFSAKRLFLRRVFMQDPKEIAFNA